MATGNRRELSIHRFGDGALHVRLDDQTLVHRLVDLLLPALARGLVEDVIPADGSMLITFDGTDSGERRARRAFVEAAAVSRDPAWIAAREEPRKVVIPVRYGGADGPDLAEAADLAGCSPADLVRRHHEPEYTVRFLGFAPGFPYIGDLPSTIAVPRLASPRTTTKPGSVAIAERYTGIYPADLPGGWRVIGWSPVELFDPAADPPTHLLPGDRVRFEVMA